jgi:hypothetical protein
MVDGHDVDRLGGSSSRKQIRAIRLHSVHGWPGFGMKRFYSLLSLFTLAVFCDIKKCVTSEHIKGRSYLFILIFH